MYKNIHLIVDLFDQVVFILVKMEWIESLIDVDTEEALGLLAALEWVHKLQLNNVNFELDSKRSVDHFHSKYSDVSNFGACH